MNNIYYNLERKFSKYAIRDLNKYMAVIYALGLLIITVNPMFYYTRFSLNIGMLLSGQIWRILTFIIYPPFVSISIFLSLFGIYIYYTFTTALIYAWSDFKFNLYIVGGMIFYIIVGIITYFIFGPVIMEPTYLAFSIFIGFAFTFPDTTFLMFFFIPIRAKYLAMIEIVLYLVMFIFASLSDKASIIAVMLHITFFVLITDRYSFKNFINKLMQR